MDHDYTTPGNIYRKKSDITQENSDILIKQDEPPELNQDPSWVVEKEEPISVTSPYEDFIINHPEKNEISPTICPVCNKEYPNRTSRNNHVKRVHNLIIPYPQRSNMMCPLCRKKDSDVTTYEQLAKHIKTLHKISIEKIYIRFNSVQDYDWWKTKEKIKSSYCVERYKSRSTYRECHLVCNRSDTKGRTEAHEKRKKHASLAKIQGICPSRMIVKFYKKGHVKLFFWTTHVGHESGEAQFLRLTDVEKNWIVGKLKSGLSKKEIIEQAKQLESSEFGRINLLNYNLVVHLAHKYNIENTTNPDLLRSATINVKRWAKEGLDIAFFFKAKGKTHEKLDKDDFGVGLMNSLMQEKLTASPSIICIETANDDYENSKLYLMILLVRDDDGTGFPAAFFISNRTDYIMLQLFFKALTDRVGEILADYFFSDDDSKYYDAWVSVMGNDPHRFISTWHVLNNLEKEAKLMMENADLIQEVRPVMTQIVTEPDRERFVIGINNYLTKLKQFKEDDFLRYLFGQYLQEHQIQMWAHWFRVNFDCYINGSFETSQLKGKTNTTAKKLLYSMESFDLNLWTELTTNGNTEPCSDNVEDSNFDEEIPDEVSSNEVEDQKEAIKLKREELHAWLDSLDDESFEIYLTDTERFRKEQEFRASSKINIIDDVKIIIPDDN